MGIVGWTWLLVGASLLLYVVVGIWGKARTTSDFYVAEKAISPVLNGMATAADWISAASFISMAGVIASMGRDGSQYLMGWTGGYTLLAVLVAPYLRKYGKFTVPQFMGDRYYSPAARGVALACAILVSFTYVAGQMRGVGVVFSRFLGTSIELGVVAGMVVVLLYATLGGMKGITYTQVAQYVVLTAAFLLPAIFISLMLTGNPVPQLGLGSTLSEDGARILGASRGTHLLEALDGISTELGFGRYTAGRSGAWNTAAVTFTLMVGTAGLPHILIRFFTVPKIRDARSSAGWALFFIAILFTTAPAIAAFARATSVAALHGARHDDAPSWFRTWERTGLVAWEDRNRDGVMQMVGDPAVNEVAIDPDIMVLATPEIARLPDWIVALVAAGALAAALSTAAGLLLVIAAAISHDLLKGLLVPQMSERQELRWARAATAGAVILAGYFGVHPPASVAQVVAFAFGLAASSFFPAIILGIFWRRATKEAAIAGMLTGILFTGSYVLYFGSARSDPALAARWLLGISPEGIGMVGAVLSLAVMVAVSLLTPPPPQGIQDFVANLRYPKESTPPRGR